MKEIITTKNDSKTQGISKKNIQGLTAAFCAPEKLSLAWSLNDMMLWEIVIVIFHSRHFTDKIKINKKTKHC